MVKVILFVLAALFTLPALTQTSATVEVVADIPWADPFAEWETPGTELLDDYRTESGTSLVIGGSGGGGAITPPPPPPPPQEPRACYGFHDWQIDLNPGGLITGSYSGRTTAVWKYDALNATVMDPMLVWAGRSNGVGVTCEGAITGAGAAWTGVWEAKQSTGIVWKNKKISAIYNLAATLSTFESSVN